MTNSFNSLPTPESNEKLNFEVRLEQSKDDGVNSIYLHETNLWTKIEGDEFVEIEIKKHQSSESESKEDLAKFYLEQVFSKLYNHLGYDEKYAKAFSFKLSYSTSYNMNFKIVFDGLDILEPNSKVRIDDLNNILSIQSAVINPNLFLEVNSKIKSVDSIIEMIRNNPEYEFIIDRVKRNPQFKEYDNPIDIVLYWYFNEQNSAWCKAYYCDAVANNFNHEIFSLILDASTGDEIGRLRYN